MPKPMPAKPANTMIARDTGLAALQAGDAATARRCFELVTESGDTTATIWSALALACRDLRDLPAMNHAADMALGQDYTNLPALILKGDFLLASGDPRAATSFYGVAVALAERSQGHAPWLAALVRHAAAARDRINNDIERHMRERLQAGGYDRARSSPRFSHALDLLTGRKQRYLQQPRALYFPDLSDTQFHPRKQFPWLDAIEAATDVICAELLQVLEERGTFVPYIQPAEDLPTNGNQHLLNSLDWTAHFLWKDGAPVSEHAARCPRTLAALRHAPLVHIAGRAPSILFSSLRPGARIAPHTGFLNCRLICHLPLIVPNGCRLRVGNEERELKRGQAWAFNDTIEHEAANGSAEPRIILIFDVWHPELDAEERGLVSALMQAVDSYGNGTRTSWND